MNHGDLPNGSAAYLERPSPRLEFPTELERKRKVDATDSLSGLRLRCRARHAFVARSPRLADLLGRPAATSR
jgi:hypothetical protein